MLPVMLLQALLQGCAEMPNQWDTQGYTVKRGDTLYSIAWRYEKDYRQIAQYNDIESPYAIYPGQRIRMQAADKDGTTTEDVRPQVLTEVSTGAAIVIEDSSSTNSAAIESTSKPSTSRPSTDRPSADNQSLPVTKPKPKLTHTSVRKNETLYAIAKREGYSHHQLARWNHLRSPYLLKPGQKLRLSPPASSLGQAIPDKTAGQVGGQGGGESAVVSTQAVTRPVADSVSWPVAVKALPLKIDRWHWPIKGRVVQTYRANDTARKGIHISGKFGQPVKAAARGTVVYSGNGLINYGNLVIIKHSHSFLSAYAYNQSLLVKEGDSVKRGQAIAKMGKLDAKPRLHFEIRRNGKPVNPLHYLPKS